MTLDEEACLNQFELANKSKIYNHTDLSYVFYQISIWQVATTAASAIISTIETCIKKKITFGRGLPGYIERDPLKGRIILKSECLQCECCNKGSYPIM